jgi:hypothetical protein
MPATSHRSVSPLQPAQDALLLDNSDLSIEDSVHPGAGLVATAQAVRPACLISPGKRRAANAFQHASHSGRRAPARWSLQPQPAASAASTPGSALQLPGHSRKSMSVTTTVTAQGGAASFAALFEESLKSNDMRVGEVISAEVVRIEFNHVVVNAGLKSESYVAIEEFKNDQGELEVQVGDFVSVAIDAVENGYGDTILSAATRPSAWRRG